MPKSLHRPVPPLELNRVDTVPPCAGASVNKVDLLPDRAMHMAKAEVGAAVKEAIGTRPLKQFGDKGLLSNVVSGEKAPEWLARIYSNPETRRAFALAWLKDDADVKVRTVIEIDDRKVG